MTFRGKPIRITPDFPNQVMKARRAWSNIFQMLNNNNLQPRISYPAKLSLKVDGEIKTFHDKQKLKECWFATKPALEKILKEINHKEKLNNNHQSQRNNRYHQSNN